MAQNQNSGQGCLGCLTFVFILLGFTHPGWWIAAFVLSCIANANNSQPSTSTTSIPSPSPPVPDDLDNILMDLSNGEIKDPVTQEIFRPGEQVHLCHVHRLAYHEDSWTEMGCRCMVCGNPAHTKVYILPSPVNLNFEMAEKLGIEFRDIE
jgi:hypothetical protein